MARTLTFRAKHALGVEGVKAAITERYKVICVSPVAAMVSSAEMRWEGDTAHIAMKALGAKGTAEIAVTDHNVTIVVHLPLVLAPFAGLIEKVINANEDAIRPRPETPE